MRKLLMGLLAVMVMTGLVYAGVTASHEEGVTKRVKLRFKAEPIVISEGGSGTNAFGGVKVFTWDEGRISIDGVVFNIKIGIATNLVNDGSGINVAIGTVTAIATTGSVAHTSTRVDLGANVEVDPWTNGVTAFGGELAADAQFDGTTTAIAMYINVLVDDGDISQASVTGTVDGTVLVTYTEVGDR